MAEQCRGITKAGTQCRITRNLSDGYCRFHRDQKPRSDSSSEESASAQRSEGENRCSCTGSTAAIVVLCALLVAMAAVVALVRGCRNRS